MKFLVFVILCLTFTASHAETLIVNVVGVNDGDSITVIDSDLNQLKVRLEQIDSPELGQPFGNQSKQALSDLVFGKTVTLVTISKDRYGRYVAEVYCEGINANEAMISQGRAWVYTQYAKKVSALH